VWCGVDGGAVGTRGRRKGEERMNDKRKIGNGSEWGDLYLVIQHLNTTLAEAKARSKKQEKEEKEEAKEKMPTSTSLSLQILDYLDTYITLSPNPLPELVQQIREDIQNGELPRKFDVTRRIREKNELHLKALIQPLEGVAFLTSLCLGNDKTYL